MIEIPAQYQASFRWNKINCGINIMLDSRFSRARNSIPSLRIVFDQVETEEFERHGGRKKMVNGVVVSSLLRGTEIPARYQAGFRWMELVVIED